MMGALDAIGHELIVHTSVTKRSTEFIALLEKLRSILALAGCKKPPIADWFHSAMRLQHDSAWKNPVGGVIGLQKDGIRLNFGAIWREHERYLAGELPAPPCAGSGSRGNRSPTKPNCARGWHYLPDSRSGKVSTIVMAYGYSTVGMGWRLDRGGDGVGAYVVLHDQLRPHSGLRHAGPRYDSQ
jgi:hypothetical protein